MKRVVLRVSMWAYCLESITFITVQHTLVTRKCAIKGSKGVLCY